MPALGEVLDPFCVSLYVTGGFHNGSADKESACNAGDAGLIPGLGRSPEKEMATHRILAWENPMDRGGLQTMVPQKSWI